MSSSMSSSSRPPKGPQRAAQPRHEPPVEDDVLTEGSEGDMEDDMLTGALYTRDGMPLCEALVYIATSIANLSNSIQTTSEKSLRLQKYIARQLQTISAALTMDQASDEEEEATTANSTAAQIDAPEAHPQPPQQAPQYPSTPSPSPPAASPLPTSSDPKA